MRLSRTLALPLLLVIGCSPRAALKKAATSPEAQFARESASLLFKKDVDALLARMAPDLRREATPEVLARLLAAIPPGDTEEPTLVGYRYSASPRATQAIVSLQYEFPETYVVVQVQMRQSGGERAITFLNLERLPDSLQRLNAFRLRGQSVGRYVFLSFAAMVPIFTLYCLFVCARTPLPRGKWLWLAFVAVGIGRISLNWTTGALSFTPLSFQLLGAGATTAGPYAPWVVSVALPIGAVAFLVRRGSLLRTRGAAKGDGVEQTDTADEATPRPELRS